MASETITEIQSNNNIFPDYVIADKNGNLMFRYQNKVFTPEENLRNFIYPVPKFTLVTSGTAEWNINNTVYNLCPGDIVILRPSCVRYFNNINPDSLLACEIYEFIPSFLKNMECLDIFRQESTTENTFIPHNNENNLDLIKLLDNIKEELSDPQGGCVDMIRAYFTMLVISASRKLGIKTGSDRIIPWKTCENYEESPPFEYSNGVGSHHIQNTEHALAMSYIMDMIRSNITGEISIDTLADDVHMSRSHFFKVFKRYNGLSVNDFILKCRIEHTINLLMDTGCNIIDAAYASGFASSSGFYKAFKKIMGQSPKEYVQNMGGSWTL